jgi:tRNA threonylcarbamoyladenosine biosynthesis protein TsaB
LAIFLYIDTAGEKAIVAISNNEQLLASAENTQSNTHASFVQVAIEEVAKTAGIQLQEIDAVVVTMGPGSYTGLRVGLSSAKGIAYALQKPLIGLSTLALLAEHAIQNAPIASVPNLQLFSMIDAKRMEVFGAIYKTDRSIIVAEQAIILSEDYLKSMLAKGPLLCVGNGASKTKALLTDPDLYFLETSYTTKDLINLAQSAWSNKQFEDLAYSKPAYLKDFYQKPAL